MLEDGILYLFPPRGLDQSILVAVLMGMMILLFLTEAFGWVFVGLVVPGYLASVAVIQPSSAIAVFFESVLTYLLVRAVSEGLARFRAWSPFFGRERFLLIVVISVLVRQNSQIWLLPLVVRQIDEAFGTAIYTDLDFYSIGLVLIPLTANMFWKLGLMRGALQVGVPTVGTYALLTLVFLPYTNLSFGSLALTYENVALDFLGSPKAYMILLTGAFLAAHYNLRYGWDYNGIMVPSLLALSWFTPMTVVMTLAEAVLLYLLTRLFLALPPVRTLNLEGPRKVSLIFALGFLAKYAGGWLLGDRLPEARLTDFFGFGYVLTSLIAVKMINKRAVGRVLLPTLQVSVVAFVIGSLIGYGLEQLAPAKQSAALIAERDQTSTETLMREPLGVMALAEVRARVVLPEEIRDGRSGLEIRDYGALWRRLDRWLAGGAESVTALRNQARALGLSLRRVDRGLATGEIAYALVEREERLGFQTGWETALLVPGAPGPYIEVPAPRSEAPAALAAVSLCRSLRCRGILASGGDSRLGNAANALEHPRASFHVAHRQLRAAPVVQLRADETVNRGRPVLHLKHTLPPHIDLTRLWPRELALRWEAPPAVPQQWGARRDTVVLRIHPDDLWARLIDESPPIAPSVPGVNLARYVAPLVARAPNPLDPSSLEVLLPSESELRFLETLIADHLLQDRWDRIAWLGRLARLVDYKLVHLDDCAGPDQGCWVLAQSSPREGLPLGLLAVRTGATAPIAVEVPRPQREFGTFRIGVEIWVETGSHALLVNPDEKLTGKGMRLDPTIVGNPVTPFQALHQAIHRGFLARQGVADPAAEPGLILQIRGFAGWRAAVEDMIIGMGPPVMQPWQVPRRLREIVAPGGALGWLYDAMRYADGSEELIFLAGQGSPQLAFSRSIGSVDFAMVWLSERAREQYRPASRAGYGEHFRQAGFAFSNNSTFRALGEPALDAPTGPPSKPAQDTFARLLGRAQHYAVTRDIHVLRALRRDSRDTPGVAVEAYWNPSMSLPFLRLEVEENDQVLRAVVLLHPLAAGVCEQQAAYAEGVYRDTVSQLVRRCGVITATGTRNQ